MKSAEGKERPRKRSRASEDADDAVVAPGGGKKARGRPRVDTQDATAADRRRTQIRLAQRAYRQRKETTISSLREQSAQLHTIIDEMNKMFLSFSDSILQSGLLQMNPKLSKELKQMTEAFVNYVKSANERTLESDEEELGEAAPAQKKQESTAASVKIMEPQSSQVVTPPEHEQSWGYVIAAQGTKSTQLEADIRHPESYFAHISSSSYELPEPSHQSSVVRRYQFSAGGTGNQSTSSSKAMEQPQPTSDQDKDQRRQQQHLPFGLVDLPSREQSPFVPPYIFPVNVPAMGAELPPASRQLSKADTLPSLSLTGKTLSPGYTYSHEEVTFARRLMRATVESGFLLLSNPNVHPAILNHVFKLSLPYVTLEEIRTRFKIVLSRGVTEDLDWYATPFLHLGGAGTHYQRRDVDGKPIPLRNNWTIRQIGPASKQMIRVESVANGQTQEFEGIDLSGFEGEWFDPFDVQGYLEDRWNCKIDPKSSFAECLVEDENADRADSDTENPSQSHGSTTSTLDATPPIPQSFHAYEHSYGLDMTFGNAPASNFLSAPSKQSLLDLSFDQTLGLDLAPGFDMGFAGSDGYSRMGLGITDETLQLPVVKQREKRIAWVDIHRLVEKLVRQAVCLGRAPGFRRKDVDMAFREALIPAY